MARINLPTGNTIDVSTYEFYFKLEDGDMDLFFQSCMADNLGVYIDHPFSNRRHQSTLEEPEIIPEEIQEPDIDI